MGFPFHTGCVWFSQGWEKLYFQAITNGWTGAENDSRSFGRPGQFPSARAAPHGALRLGADPRQAFQIIGVGPNPFCGDPGPYLRLVWLKPLLIAFDDVTWHGCVLSHYSLQSDKSRCVSTHTGLFLGLLHKSNSEIILPRHKHLDQYHRKLS